MDRAANLASVPPWSSLTCKPFAALCAPSQRADVLSSARTISKSNFSDFAAIPRPFPSPLPATYSTGAPAPTTAYTPGINPVYAPYGSSVVGVTPFQAGFGKAAGASYPGAQAGHNPAVYNPEALGLPVPPPSGTSTNFAGLYSSSGFDVLSVLARVAARPNPTISIGPVDTSCAFLVVDARRYDYPIVFASETFTKLTGYSCEEISTSTSASCALLTISQSAETAASSSHPTGSPCRAHRASTRTGTLLCVPSVERSKTELTIRTVAHADAYCGGQGVAVVPDQLHEVGQAVHQPRDDVRRRTALDRSTFLTRIQRAYPVGLAGGRVLRGLPG